MPPWLSWAMWPGTPGRPSQAGQWDRSAKQVRGESHPLQHEEDAEPYGHGHEF